jgi:hypothetical protein
MLVGVAIASIAFRQLLTTRWTPCLALGGLLSVSAGGAVLLILDPSNASSVVPVASVFLGFGAGAGVTPGLFMAGLSAPAAQIGATFALVELLRSEAAFLIGPAMLHFALTRGIADGFGLAVIIMLLVTLAGAVVLVGLYLLGGAPLRRPDLESWISGQATAYNSPALGARLRKA